MVDLFAERTEKRRWKGTADIELGYRRRLESVNPREGPVRLASEELVSFVDDDATNSTVLLNPPVYMNKYCPTTRQWNTTYCIKLTLFGVS